MKQPAINEQLVRRYLLDALPKRERERVDVGLLTDDRYYEALTTLESEVEDELIDQYLDGELTGTELENFERLFLNSPERAHKLKVKPLPKLSRKRRRRESSEPIRRIGVGSGLFFKTQFSDFPLRVPSLWRWCSARRCG
jgi:hypothetical protein